MGAKSTPLAIKVAIYERLLSGQMSREIGRSYVLSQPTVLKYANDAVDALRRIHSIDASPVLLGFLSRKLKTQCFQYPDDDEVRSLMAPILEPYLTRAESIDFAGRESADQPLSTRVSRSTEEEFLQIVSSLAEGQRPGMTPSALLRELVENFVTQHRGNQPAFNPATAPIQQVAKSSMPAVDTDALLADVMDAIRFQFAQHGLAQKPV
ncbi:hypothetical protein PVE_P0334 (plasmid) [Pseudomonas veronii 1YdBTEX2]|uniref:Uncharacterized protein n=2 Tax=Pseudomonas veronii TaxID=76761 RepID=A0A7Y1FCT5_PSEVE|nr:MULTISPECIES: hypothetical protein [Pseudomonas]SBW85372.1 hypothetical protein PVE_P0334 [Pseudomonas veronii 1YdBTEX2]KAA0945291.1 hypothetical protein FQ186_28725 [Pseudomonas sp. ANT_H14]KAA0946320.1 hypothetical protein FQ182_14265 [Pseudomonas sp. ANT_H4]MBI6556453.1 hypothetical protein [Pseudomonas veronii]MBI6653913.1 hypothetical protein [Pseudomonas veronii]